MNTTDEKIGFNCNFDALDSNGRLNELSEALSTMFSASQKITLLDILQLLTPALRIIASIILLLT